MICFRYIIVNTLQTFGNMDNNKRCVDSVTVAFNITLRTLLL